MSIVYCGGSVAFSTGLFFVSDRKNGFQRPWSCGQVSVVMSLILCCFFFYGICVPVLPAGLAIGTSIVHSILVGTLFSCFIDMYCMLLFLGITKGFVTYSIHCTLQAITGIIPFVIVSSVDPGCSVNAHRLWFISLLSICMFFRSR